MQLLPEFKKILYMGFRATLNFRKFKVAKKHYPETVKIGNNRDCVVQGWLSTLVVRDFISHSLHSVVA